MTGRTCSPVVVLGLLSLLMTNGGCGAGKAAGAPEASAKPASQKLRRGPVAIIVFDVSGSAFLRKRTNWFDFVQPQLRYLRKGVPRDGRIFVYGYGAVTELWLDNVPIKNIGNLLNQTVYNRISEHNSMWENVLKNAPGLTPEEAISAAAQSATRIDGALTLICGVVAAERGPVDVYWFTDGGTDGCDMERVKARGADLVSKRCVRSIQVIGAVGLPSAGRSGEIGISTLWRQEIFGNSSKVKFNDTVTPGK